MSEDSAASQETDEQQSGSSDAAQGPDGAVGQDQGGGNTDWEAEATHLRSELAKARKWQERAQRSEKGAQTAADKAQSAQQQLHAVAKALGLADDEATPEKLQAQLSEREQQVAQRDELLADMQRERQAEKAARKHKADIDLLLPALTYNGLLDNLDPNDDDFADKIDKIVGEFVQKNPKYLAAASFPDLRQGNQGQGAAASNDPNAWLRQLAGRQ